MSAEQTKEGEKLKKSRKEVCIYFTLGDDDHPLEQPLGGDEELIGVGDRSLEDGLLVLAGLRLGHCEAAVVECEGVHFVHVIRLILKQKKLRIQKNMI